LQTTTLLGPAVSVLPLVSVDSVADVVAVVPGPLPEPSLPPVPLADSPSSVACVSPLATEVSPLATVVSPFEPVAMGSPSTVQATTNELQKTSSPR
jgi:hypothetical protein